MKCYSKRRNENAAKSKLYRLRNLNLRFVLAEDQNIFFAVLHEIM